MEYSIHDLANLAEISTRTLRYYDEIGLLSPKRKGSNDYRVYGQTEVDYLQQILFYRELGLSLEEIKSIIWSKNYDGISALQEHLKNLIEKKERIERLINSVEKTIAASKGDIMMSNLEKFEGFKKTLLRENEVRYGEEVLEAFGDDVVKSSNEKLMSMTAKQYDEIQELSKEINRLLKIAFEQGNPASELAQNVCAMHKDWLCYFWQHYSKEAHLAIAQTYVDDSRFKEYYDSIAEGCSEFLRDAIAVYCK